MDKKEITKVLAFFVMSDAGLTMHEGCVNASFHLSMKMENSDVIDYLTPYLDELDVGYRTSIGDKYFRLNTRVHPFFTRLYERIYPMGHKTPSPHDFKLLDWEAMAILYMCDGNIQKGGSRWYPMLNLCCFSYAELHWIRTQVKQTLAVDMNVYKCGKYWRLGVPAKDCNRFFDGVAPYVLPSFSYKLPYGKPQDVLGGEIVRPMGKPMELGGNTLA